MTYSVNLIVQLQKKEDTVKGAKPFNIDKRIVYEAFKKIKANGGGTGIDNVTIEGYSKNTSQNLFNLWNRMSSGCCFPQAVKLVEIPKGNSGKRPLGILSVNDRIAQMTIALSIQPILEPHFHEDSYDYRPNKSAHDAVAAAQRRCFQYPWVLDMDISKFFHTIDHDLLMKALKRHITEKWILLYIEKKYLIS